MPHIVLEGPISLEDIWLAYRPVEIAEGQMHFKTEDCYLSADKAEILVRTVVVDKGFSQRFFTRLHQREGAVTIKIDPLTDPGKSAAVKRMLAIVAETILLAWPEARVVRTNIPETLKIDS